MDLSALVLSRLQFAFTVSFHIIFPSFTIGPAAWLTVLEALHLTTGRPVYRIVFEFWLKIFGIAFGLGVVSGIVMAFQLGTNWSEFSRTSGPIQGPLLAYETFTAFALEASFFGVSSVRPADGAVVLPLLDRDGRAGHHVLRVLDHGQQQLDAGAWSATPSRTALSCRPIGARSSSARSYGCAFPICPRSVSDRGVLRRRDWSLVSAALRIQGRGPLVLRMGLYLAAILVPAQLFFGHLTGDYVHDHQPAKFAAIEGRWRDEQPASEVLIALPILLRRRTTTPSACRS